MNNKNIIIAGAIAIGLYLFSQTKKITTTTAQKVAQRTRSTTTPTVRQRTAQKIAQKITQKVAQKVAPKKIGQPTTWIGYIAARKAAAQKAAAQKAAAQKAWLYWNRKKKVRKKAAAQKAAVRKATAKKIGKKIGKKVAQNMAQKIKTRRAVAAWYAKRQKPLIQRPNQYKKQRTAKLFPGAEKSRVILYKEGSKHSYYGPKSRKVLNEGYMEKRYKADQKQAQDAEMEELRRMFPSDWA